MAYPSRFEIKVHAERAGLVRIAKSRASTPSLDTAVQPRRSVPGSRNGRASAGDGQREPQQQGQDHPKC